MSELNGRRPGAPVQGEPDQTRPVTFTWQRGPAAQDEEALNEAAAAAQQGAPAGPPQGPPSGAQPAVATGPPSGAYPAAQPQPAPPQQPGPPLPPPQRPPTHSQSKPNLPPATGGQPAVNPPQATGGQLPYAAPAPARRNPEPRPAPPRPEPEPTPRRRRPAQSTRGPETPFPVPPPGGRLSHGRGAHLAVRVGIAFTCCLLLLGFTFILGLLAGRIGSTNNDGVSSGQLSQYHVEQYPLQAAAAVAERYTRLCLNAQPATADRRSAQIQSIVSNNVPNDCGWDGRGTISATDIEWTGQADPMSQYGAHGRYLHMQAAIGDQGTPIQLIVPVYVSDLRNGTGVRIAGEPGILPASGAPSGPDAVAEKGGSSDTGLAQMLTADVLPGFFDAWGSSSGADIDRYRTPDASNNVRQGLSNALTSPDVQAVNVPLPDAGIGNTHTWQTGDAATVETSVTWQLSGGAHITLGYRLTMVKTSTTATGWSVRDIAGGLPDSDVDNTTGDSVPTELPSNVPSTEPTPSPTQASPSPSAHASPHPSHRAASTRHSTSHQSPHHRS